MTHDTFNRLITVTLTLFFMVLYTWSFVTGKHLDIAGILAFVVPALNNVVHILSRNAVAITSINKNGGNGDFKEGQVTKSGG